MKKMLFVFCSLSIHCSATAELQNFSAKAQELIREYTPRATPATVRFPLFYPPLNREVHLTEEYRPAWEELYRKRVMQSVDADLFTIGDGYMAIALSLMASTNSIPLLVDVYTQLLEINKDVNQGRQKEILDILLYFKNSEALDAIFSLLDLSDVKYKNNSPYQIQIGMTLRESVWQDMLNPKPAMTLRDQKERTERAEQWRDKINAYQNDNLSVNNTMFVEKARNLSRKPEEQNKNADVPLP